jgi:mRNA deadenylase 3'-5' endonuclease subunit Ccr4
MWYPADAEPCTKLTVVQLNILADGLASKYFYPQTYGQSTISFPARFERIMSILLSLNPDIICMQEVNHIEWFKTKFEKLEYNFVNHLKLSKSIEGFD